MIDNLKTSLLFRMLDLFLRVLAFGSAPAGCQPRNQKKDLKKYAYELFRKYSKKLKIFAAKIQYHTNKEQIDLTPNQALTFLPEENLLSLSPHMLVKALAKIPLVDLLQIFSDCEPRERLHILKALREVSSGDSLTPEHNKPISENLEKNQIPEVLDHFISGYENPTLPEATFQNSVCSATVEPNSTEQDLTYQKPLSPPCSPWDEEGNISQFLEPLPVTQDDWESGMGIDSLAFLRWVDEDKPLSSPPEQKWSPPPPLFEDMPKAPPRRELLSFITGGNHWDEDEITKESEYTESGNYTEDVEERADFDPPHESSPPRELRSLPPKITETPGTIHVFEENTWNTFRPLFAELSVMRQRYVDRGKPHPHLMESSSQRIGAQKEPPSPPIESSQLPQDPIKQRPPRAWKGHSRRRRHSASPCSPPGRGLPPGLPLPGGPPAAPLPRRSAPERSFLRSRHYQGPEYRSMSG